MKAADYLDSQLICFLDVSTQEEAIDVLIAAAVSAGKVPNQASFRQAILQREQLVSTGIGMGIAIPHAKLKELRDFFVVIGIQRKKGIEWDALDKAPVRLIFLIGGPDHRQSEYLQILSRLTAAVKEPEARKEVLAAETPAAVLHIFENY